MQNITQVSNTADFELKTVHWKGVEYSFWCKVLTAREAREMREKMFEKNNQISAKKAQARPEWVVNRCVYIDKPDGSEKPHVEFMDADGEYHELVRAFTEMEVQAMKDPLLNKVAKICDEVNKTQVDEEEEEALGNL